MQLLVLLLISALILLIHLCYYYALCALWNCSSDQSVADIINSLRQRFCSEGHRTSINAVRSNPFDALLNAMERPNFNPADRLDVVRFTCQ
jgi:hypothetical protein